MSSSTTLDSLEIIKLEIIRLKQKSIDTGLNLAETKQLESLVKLMQLLIGEPIDITKIVAASEKEEVSDADILAALRPQSRENSANAAKKKKKTPPRPN